MKAFDPLDQSSWPNLLTGRQIALIWQVTTSTIDRRVREGQFIQPADIPGPRRWRKSDVVRVIGRAA